MTSQDLNMVTKILLGITNPDKNIRTESVNKLQELRKNLGALTFCLLQITQIYSNKINNNNINIINNNKNEDQIIITSALVICRKILDINDTTPWNNINENLKNEIKLKSLELFINEKNESQKIKIGDVITQIIDKISDNDEDWEDFKKLSLTLLNLNPNDENNLIQINCLLKLITDGTGFLYEIIKENFDKFIPYFNLIFQSKYLKLKTSLTNLISELISFSDKEDIELFQPFIFNILQSILESFNQNNEEYLKDLLETIIELSSIEPKIFKKYFQDIFTICKGIIDKKDYSNEKIRELAFEVLINLIEELPELFNNRKNDLKILFSMIYSYSFEINKEISFSWNNPSIHNYKEIEKIEEDNILFSQGLIERIIDYLDQDEVLEILNEISINLINQKDWIFKYIGLLSFSNLSNYQDEEISLNDDIFNTIISLTKDNNLKVKFAAINCINKLCNNYNPNFQNKNINIIIPLLMEIYPNETSLKIQCEIIETITSFIQFINAEKILLYVSQILNLLFNIFMKDVPIILRKLIIECLLEIFSTIEERSEPFAKKSFEIILNYFIEIYKSKSNKILYGKLIENLTTIGPYIKEDFYKYVPDIINCIIELVKGINFNNDPIRSDLQNSIERLFPILKKDFNYLLPNLVDTILSLVKLKPKLSSSSNSEKEIDFSELYDNNNNDNLNNENNNKHFFDLNTGESEDFIGSISLLNIIIESMGKNYLNYIEETEKEILSLFNDSSLHNKIKTKSCKILSNLIKIIPEEKKREKGILYIKYIIEAIEKETNNHIYEKLIINLKNILDNSGEILEENELNELFNKIMIFYKNFEEKKQNLLSKKSSKKKKNHEEEFVEENLKELIEEDIQNIENIQTEIANLIGIIIKTHKKKAVNIIKIILKELLPKYLKSKLAFELKIALYIIDDLIEYLGQEVLLNIWNNLFEILINLIKNPNDEIKQASIYGIGIFAKFTKENYSNYAERSIIELKEIINLNSNNNKKNEESDFDYIFDNVISAFGKIIYFQFDCDFIQKNLYELIDIWISNLPIKFDNNEIFSQHELLCDFFLEKKNFISQNLFYKFIIVFIQIFNSKNSNLIINNKIINIFSLIKNDDFLKNIVLEIYNNESSLREKINDLLK